MKHPTPPLSLTPLSEADQAELRRMIGERCQRARQQLGLSQRALARLMDRSPSWVREIEAGQQFAPAYLIRALATATRLPVGWFYGDEPPSAEELAGEILQAVAVGLSSGRWSRGSSSDESE